jgi:hypothetical protein
MEYFMHIAEEARYSDYPLNSDIMNALFKRGHLYESYD